MTSPLTADLNTDGKQWNRKWQWNIFKQKMTTMDFESGIMQIRGNLLFDEVKTIAFVAHYKN